MTPDRLYHDALDLHRNGRLADAEARYRQMLAAQPRHAQALHYLGVLCHQTRRHDEAVKLIAAALELAPHDADYLNNYGLALRAAGRLDEAAAAYRAAIAQSPMDMDLHNNLGNACQVLGRFEEAAGCYRRVLHAVGLSRSGGATFPRAMGILFTWLAYVFASVALLFYAIA